MKITIQHFKYLPLHKLNEHSNRLTLHQGPIVFQAGTNKCASQTGMSIGSVRHVADIRADNMTNEGKGVIGLQAGTNKGASQKGMSIGAVR